MYGNNYNLKTGTHEKQESYMKDHGEKMEFENNMVSTTLLLATVVVYMSTQSKTNFPTNYLYPLCHIYTHILHMYFSRVRQTHRFI